MSRQPKLIQSYYTLEETVSRLKRSGAEINRAQALLHDEAIPLSMLCNNRIALIKADDVQPIKINWFPGYEVYNLNDLINFQVYEPAEISGLLEDLENEDWLLSNVQSDNKINIDDYSCKDKKPLPISFVQSTSSETSIISPSNLNDKNIGKDVNFFGLNYKLTSGKMTLKNTRLITEIHGERFYGLPRFC